MKKKKGKIKKKVKVDSKDYEGFTYGPFKFERLGRVVRMSSHWEPSEFKRHIERIREGRPKHKKEIDEKIGKLLSIIKEFEPLELLATVSSRNCFTDPEKYREITHKGREGYAEYALSLALSQNRKQRLKHATKEVIEEFNSLIEKICNDVLWYFGSEISEGRRSEIEEEIRFKAITSYLILRGDSFDEHHLELLKGIFKEHDDFLRRNYGFDSAQMIIGIQNIEEQLLFNIQSQTKFWSIMRELHELFKAFVDKEGIKSFSSVEDCKKKFHALPAVQEKKRDLKEFQNSIDEHPFEIKPTDKAPLDMIESLSSKFGDNKSFATFKRFPGWPTNDSIIYDRPLIQHDSKFYCFVPQVMFRKIGDILEGWIQQKDDDYYQNTYTKNRARYLENKALEYLSSILPQAEVYGKLFYWVDENGERKRVETDGLIFYDENLFIIEAKAGSVSASARRGGLERIKRDSKELIDKAYEQALRTKKFIMETPEPAFQYEDGSEAVVIKDKTKYRNIYLLNVTLESLGHLSTQLNSLKSLNLIDGKEWPWSVFINDLRVISELIEFPSEFLLFLQRRIRANDYPQFQALDELDFLMYYFREGLYFEDGALNGMNRFTLFAYTEDLDRYYDFLGGKVSTGEKPKLRIAGEYKDLIREIEATGKDGFTRVTTTLLNFDWKVQREILDHLKSLGAASVRECRDHDFTLQFKEMNLGITLSTSAARDYYSLKKLESYSYLKMYETRFEEWILITVDFHGDGTRDIDFQVFNKRWEYHPTMEEQLKKFKASKIASYRKSGQNIGRNDPCPCGSGLKYKKCCGKIS